MKNTLKKVLCTALAAVSLSAMVTVPSSLNKPNSDNSIVNVMEADAAKKERCVDYKLYKAVKAGKIRSTPTLKADNVINTFKKGDVFIGYDTSNNFISIAPKTRNGNWAVDNNYANLYQKKGWIYTKGGHLDDDSCTFTIQRGQKTRVEPSCSAIYDGKFYGKGRKITVQKITLEKVTEGKYRLWGYFESDGSGHWIRIVGGEHEIDVNGANVNDPEVKSDNFYIQREIENMMHKATSFYQVK
ncbi:hypothetical protein [Ruminococcus flavefaciens]|uniref:hypothetical protein n=1 Tax=Ruminococcus flavefaciens TaxID=1265 RepID=UPI000467A681|nr:hypothetical protein [Ruminococcus flavefaciens]